MEEEELQQWGAAAVVRRAAPQIGCESAVRVAVTSAHHERTERTVVVVVAREMVRRARIWFVPEIGLALAVM